MRKNIYLTEEDVVLLATLKKTHGENESNIYRLGLQALSGNPVRVEMEDSEKPVFKSIERRAFPKEADRIREAKRNAR